MRLPRLLVATIAIVYATLACLRTVADFDTGWHLATGRFLLRHHTVPSTDILSYTSGSAAWHYPPFAGALLYVIFQRLGYAGLSWFCALAAAVLALYLLRRAVPALNLASAVLLLVAVPSFAYRMTPRADLFSTLLFALFLVELWRLHRGEPARLWVLPAAMLLWVNLHPGFIAGLGLIAAYLLCELLQLPFAALGSSARRRIAKAWPWLAATVAVTPINPWGIGAFEQARVLAGVGVAPGASRAVGELSAQPLSWHVLAQALQLRDPDSAFWWLLLAACVAVAQALRRRELGAAALLIAATAAAIQRLRYQGLFAIVVVVVGGTLLSEVCAELALRYSRRADEPSSFSAAVRMGAIVLAMVVCAIGVLRIADLASNRYYLVSGSTSTFGAGESWWFPERAAAFIERENLPGNIFQPYNLGGFTAIRLGPRYLDYIDGRNVSGEISAEEQALLSRSPDSPLWQQVAARRNTNVMLLSLARYGGLGGFDLNAYCDAKQWRPVYLDEVSLVLLRRTAQTEPLLDRLEITCEKATFAPPPRASRADLYNFYSNSGAVFYAMAHDGEAEAAWKHALALEPDDPNIHLLLAQLYEHKARPDEAEREYRAALAQRQSWGAWYALGRLLAIEHRYSEAESAIAIAAAMTATPANQYKALGQVQLHLDQPAGALASFREAERYGPGPDDSSYFGRDFRIQLDEGRARAYLDLQQPQRALAFAADASQLAPSARHWLIVADCYAALGRAPEAEQARARASALPTAK